MRIFPVLAISSAIVLSPLLSSADPEPAAAPAPTAPAVPAPTTQALAAPAPASTASADSSVDLDAVVCRSSAPATGTRLGGGRECHTVREWKMREQASRDALTKAQQTGYNSGGR